MEPFWKENSDYRVEKWPKWKQTLFWLSACGHFIPQLLSRQVEESLDLPKRTYLEAAYKDMTTKGSIQNGKVLEKIPEKRYKLARQSLNSMLKTGYDFND